MATKVELEAKVKLLKDKLKTANRAIKDLTAKQIDDTMEVQDMANLGVALIRSKEGPHKVVTIKFDLENNAASIDEVEDFTKANFHMAVHKVNKELTKMINKRCV